MLFKDNHGFNKSFLVIREFDGLSKLEEVSMEWCLFWVQIHSLPLGLMNEKIGAIFDEAIEDVKEVETHEDQFAWESI